MEITVQIKTSDMSKLQEVIGKITGEGVEITAPEVETPKEDKKPKTKKEAPKTETKKESKQDKVDVVEITDVDLRAKANEVAGAGKKDEVKALLAEFKVKNVTAIPQEDRADFISRLEDL